VANNKDINRFNNDLKAFGLSAAGHVPGLGKALAINDTIRKGKRLTKSAPRAFNAFQRKTKANIKRRLRKLL